ncbi:MAG: zinc-dependent metalloprotease [Bdellovibrionales bacterium]|nr:zinc-dependent metalloprotease [Bdellovibrionales bacterium]
MKAIKSITKTAGLIGFTLLAAIACTKERPLKKVTLFDVQTKSGITQGVNHLMLVSNSGLDMEAPAIAYETSQAELVQFVYRENSLDVIKTPADGKFNGNESNSKLMVSIPVTYIDTKCTEDAFGECTNVEQINEDIPWNEKGFFKPEFKDVQTPGLLSLSITMDNYFGGSCHTEQSSKLKSYKIEPGVVNFVVEKTYQTAAHCASQLQRLDQVTFTVNRHYSIVALDKLTTPGYSPLVFDNKEAANQFGFFRTSKKILDQSNQDVLSGNIEFQNRWAPGKTIVYYMNDEFNKVDSESPELNQKIKAAAYHAFAAINESLKEADASIKLELREPDPSVQVGDLRYNHLIMVHDPITRGLLGYGPSVSNPNTGEILSARTVMYKGIMKKTIKMAYDDLINKKMEQAKAAEAQQATANASVQTDEAIAEQSAISSLRPQLNQQHLQIVDNLFSLNQENIATHELVSKMPIVDVEQVAAQNQRYNSLVQTIFHQDQNSVFNQPDSFKTFFEREKRASLAEVYSQRNFYSADVFNTHAVVEQELDQLIQEFGGLKPWKALTAQQKQRAIDVILPFVWVPTMVHEMGHNLGLRHNFMGSHDKKNFYTGAELEVRGVHRDLEYSSIMDYAYGTQNELNIFGKYDIAAMRYAYGKAEVFERDDQGKIQIENGKAVKKTAIGTVEMVEPSNENEAGFVPGSERIVAKDSFEFMDALNKGLILKPYEFCTDENVSTSSICNRFDEGTSRVEVVEHYAKAWEEGYERRNLKNDRYSFDNYGGDVGHLQYLMRSMDALRQAYELYEVIKKENNIEDNDPRWTSNAFLKDIKESTIKAGEFLVEIIKTPDVSCQVVDVTQPENAPIIAPLRGISKFNASCYNLSLPPQYKVIGQAGKSLRSIKDIENPDASIIEIDVRGIWLDKLMALRTLLEKEQSIIEEHHGNFTDVPELKDLISSTLVDVMMDNHAGVLKFDNGTESEMRPYSLVEDGANRLKQPLHYGIKRFFNLPDHTVTFQEAINRVIRLVAQPIEGSENGKSFFKEFQVYKNNLPSEVKGLRRVMIDGDTYVANENNVVASKLMKFLEEVPKAQSAAEDFFKPPVEKFMQEAEAACASRAPIDHDAVEALMVLASAPSGGNSDDIEACKKDYVETAIEVFSKSRPVVLVSIINARLANPEVEAPEDADETTKALYAQDLEVLLAVLNGQSKDKSYYESMITSLNIAY